MSLSPAIIDAMIASGCTAEQLAAVVKASLAEQEGLAAEKRSKDAERQRRHRASRNVTQCHSDNADSVTAPPLSPPNDIYSNPPLSPPNTHSIARDDFPKPDWADCQTWADLKRNRRAKKLANTSTAHRQFVQKVEGMASDEWPPGRLLQAIVANGWGGAYDPRETTEFQNDRPAKQNRSGNSTRTAAQRALAIVEGANY